ncbi:Glutamate synthase 1 [NADH] chloroplastic, partial [Zea mays]
ESHPPLRLPRRGTRLHPHPACGAAPQSPGNRLPLLQPNPRTRPSPYLESQLLHPHRQSTCRIWWSHLPLHAGARAHRRSPHPTFIPNHPIRRFRPIRAGQSRAEQPPRQAQAPPPPRLEEGGQAPPSPGRRRTSPAAAWKEEDKPRRRHPRIASPCPPRPPPHCNSRRAECSPTPCTIRGRGQGRRATLGRKGIPRGRDSGGTPLPPTHNTDPLLAELPPGISVGE